MKKQKHYIMNNRWKWDSDGSHIRACVNEL